MEIHLEHARWRHFTWAVFYVAVGGILLFKLGAMGQIVGVLFLLLAGRHGYWFVRTLLRDAGTISMGSQGAALPLGLCRGAPQTFSASEVRHAFLLRRAAPWNHSAPLLVIEVADRAFVYPRDWFASESDQQRIVRATQQLLGRDMD